jgi:hypothetical protein
VQRTNIVQPGDVWVLDPTGYSALTLVTCYPFSYIGAAPQRFIVRAALRAPVRQVLRHTLPKRSTRVVRPSVRTTASRAETSGGGGPRFSRQSARRGGGPRPPG